MSSPISSSSTTSPETFSQGFGRFKGGVQDLLFTSQGQQLVKNLAFTLPNLVSNKVYQFTHGRVDLEKNYFYVPPKDVNTGFLNPLFLIHGRDGNVADFDRFVENLGREGINRPIYLISLGENGSTPVADDAAIVYKVALDLFKGTQTPVVIDCIGHSKGGNTLHYFAENLAPQCSDFMIGKAIFITSPNRGTPVTALVGGQAHDDYGIGANLIKKQEIHLLRPNYFYIANTMDHLIPVDSAIPPSVDVAHSLLLTDPRGHDLLASPAIAAQIATWLNQG